MKKFCVFLVFIFMFLAITPIFSFAEKEKYDCKSAILMDATTGKVMYEQNADMPLPPASVTKIMTLLLVMEEIEKGNLKYTDIVTASENASSMGGSQIYLKEGEEMTVEDLIKSVVIASANDGAVALAEYIAGSEEEFVSRMNKRANELGMTNTNFENTNGLDDTATNHLTSARDIAIMSRELLKHEDILKYTTIWMDTIRNGEFGLTNTNRLIRFYNGATGLKTGSTGKAGFCVSATAKRDGMHLICVVMGADSSDNRNKIASDLLNYGFSNYSLYLDNDTKLDNVKIIGGNKSDIEIGRNEYSVILNKGENKKVTKKIEISEELKAPILKGQEIGKIEYYVDDNKIGSTSIFALEEVKKIDYITILKNLFSLFLLK